MAGSHKVLIAGNEVDYWESLDYTNSMNLSVDSATISFPDSSTLLSAEGIGQDIQIQRDGSIIWRGLGMSNAKLYGMDGKKQYNLNCSSNKIYLDREAFSKGGAYVVAYGGNTSSTSNNQSSIYSTAATDIVTDILSSQNSAVLTQGKFGSSSIPHVAILFTRTMCLQALTDVVAASLWEARFNPNNTVDFESQVGVTSPTFYFDEGRNIIKGESDYGIDKLSNNVIICGSGTASGNAGGITDNQIVATGTNSTSITNYGRFSKIMNFPNVADANLLQAYANAMVDDLSNPVYTYKANVLLLESGVPFFSGDEVYVNNPSFGLNDAVLRVVSAQTHVDSQGGEDVNVVLATNLRQVNLSHFKVKALENVLNNWQANQQVMANSLQTTTSGTLPLGVGYTTSSHQIPGGPGTTFTFPTEYLQNAVTGISAGFTPDIAYHVDAGDGNVSLSSYTIQDTKTSKTYANDVLNSDDIFSHVISFSGTITNNSSNPNTVHLVYSMLLANPTIPT